MRRFICVGLVVAWFLVGGTPLGAVVTEDTFTRPDGSPANDSLGATEVGGIDWQERDTFGVVRDVAEISGNQLYLRGTGGSTTNAQAVLPINLPNGYVSADLRFELSGTAPGTARTTLGMVLRESNSAAYIADGSNTGLLAVQFTPTGGLYVAERQTGGFTAIYSDNPFSPGTAPITFLGAGGLPTVVGGAPFDANGNGYLEPTEPFNLSTYLVGNLLQVRINDLPIASITAQGTGTAATNAVALLKNHYGGSGPMIAQGYFDNLSIGNQAPAATVRLADTFSRADGSPANDSLGVTELGGFDYSERGTSPATVNDVAEIVGGQLLVRGAGVGTSNPGKATIDVNLPNVVITADLEFHLAGSGATTHNSAGFMLRKPVVDARIATPGTLGEVDVELLPTGALLVRERTTAAFNILYHDNPFAPGTPAKNAFLAPGTLPTAINGAPFDADGNGRLEAGEQFQLGAILSGNRLQVLVNDEPIAAIPLLAGTGNVGNNYLALWKNRYTSSAQVIADPYFDNLNAETPGFVIRHRGDTNPLLESWTFDQTSTAGTATPGNDGVEHWRITQVAGHRANYQTVLLPEEVNDPSGWTATAVAKVNSANPFNAELAVADGTGFWAVELAGGPGASQTGVFAARTGAVLLPLSSTDPSADYHTYQIVYNPATRSANYYMDGVGVGTQHQTDLIPTALRRLDWGDNTGGGGASDSQWGWVEFQKGRTAMTGTVVEHRGRADPTTEGFTFSSNGPHTVGPSADGLAWQVQQVGGAYANYQFQPDASNFDHPLGWTLTGALQVNDAAREFQAYLTADDNADSWQLNFVGPGSTMTPGVYANSASGRVLLSANDPTQGYHLYQIIYDPVGHGGNGLVSYYMDLALIGTQTRAEAANLAGYRRLVWGDNWSLAGVPSDSQWSWVRFETGQNYIVPEPAALVLFTLGLAVLPLAGWCRRRRRRSKEV